MRPIVIKVTISRGQARITLPKAMAIDLKVLTEEGEPGEIRYLLARCPIPVKGGFLFGVRLTAVEMSEIEVPREPSLSHPS